VYKTKQVHHSLDKDLRIAGLKECVKRYIPLDENYRMWPEALESAILKDKTSGLIPWLIIASAGTVDTGSVDPLVEIGQIAERHQLWFHIDGTYGAFFWCCAKKVKKILKGMDISDSIVMDPYAKSAVEYALGE